MYKSLFVSNSFYARNQAWIRNNFILRSSGSIIWKFSYMGQTTSDPSSPFVRSSDFQWSLFLIRTKMRMPAEKAALNWLINWRGCDEVRYYKKDKLFGSKNGPNQARKFLRIILKSNEKPSFAAYWEALLTCCGIYVLLLHQFLLAAPSGCCCENCFSSIQHATKRVFEI